MTMQHQLNAWLTQKQLSELTKIGKSGIYKAVSEGRFPPPMRLSSRCARWRSEDIAEYMADPIGWRERATAESDKEKT